MNRDSSIIPIQEGEPDALVGQRKANPAQDKTTCNKQRNAQGIIRQRVSGAMLLTNNPTISTPKLPQRTTLLFLLERENARGVESFYCREFGRLL